MARKDKKKKKDSEKGWDAEDADEAKEAEALKGTQLDEGRVDLYDKDKTTPGIQTYDEDTGELEGTILLKDGNQEGLLALVKIIEEVNVDQDHEANISNIGFVGKLNVENPSTIDRMWDIDITLSNIESTNIKDPQIKIRELGVEEDDNIDSRDFEISGEPKSLLLIKEYINTLPDADNILNISDLEKDLLSEGSESGESTEVSDDTEDDEISGDGGEVEASLESYAISIDKDNIVTFAIALQSKFDNPITNVKVIKNLPEDFTSTMVVDTSIGLTETEGNQLIWTIDELEPEITALLKFTSNIMVSDIETRKTGTIEVSYEATSSFAGGLGIEKFDAYTQNGFHVDTIEKDNAPGVWDCQLVFENTSEFIVELFNADVYSPEDETKKYIDIDPNDVPKLPAGAKWISKKWQYESEDFPSFRKRLEFRVVPDFQTLVNGTVAISDVELAIASMIGEMSYDITQVPTFTEKDIIATLSLTNNGAAALNEIIILQQNFSDEYQPPTAEEITLKLDGGEVDLAAEAVIIEEDVLKIELKNLKDSSTGMFEKDSTLEVTYPIHSINPARDSTFESEIVYLGNTYPISQELEVRPEVPVIEALHLRRKFRIGKKVLPIGALGQYQIVLSIENIGDMALQNLILMDKVPDSFEYGEYSLTPEITDEVGSDTLKWTVESLEEGEKLEITYEITGTGEYSPSDAQLAL